MAQEREEGIGINQVSDDNWQVTCNNVDNDSLTDKYGSDAYYVSYGEKGGDHATQIFDSSGDPVPDADQPEHGR